MNGYNAPGSDRIFEIIAEDDFVIRDAIEWYNRTYGKRFELVSFSYDEVTFATIAGEQVNDREIFEFGSAFGSLLADAKREGKVEY
ncbi:MAG: hypothetical protein AB8F78_07010 [Saprospiraceae bacterium]